MTEIQSIDGSRICIIIPALNEAASIGSVVASARDAVPGAIVLVVDDGSTDATASIAKSAGASVVSLPFNLGIGGAVQTGYMFAYRAGCFVAVQIDGDGQHDPNELPRVIAPIINGAADMVIGSRWLGRGDYVAPRLRKFGMGMLSRLVQWRTRQVFTDTTSGFRAVNRDIMELFSQTYPTDYPEVESIVLAVERGKHVLDVGVRMIQRQHGNSSIDGFSSPYYMIRVAMAIALGRIGRVR